MCVEGGMCERGGACVGRGSMCGEDVEEDAQTTLTRSTLRCIT